MARSRKYGKTWWGNAWVDALERIDYNTNRLPRGKRYANAGRVKEIKVDASGRVTAKVKGTRSRPYQVEIRLNRFSPAQKKIIKSVIAKDPVLASELSLGRLPEKILDRFEKNNIYLLPESWDDIDASCSCPDWANPCKHLAAVYYIIANEIDKDPFILFKLRGLDSGELLQSAGFISRDEKNGDPMPGQLSTRTLSFIPYTDIKITKNRQKQQNKQEFPIDLSSIAGNRESKAIFALLGDKPLFYSEGNFKDVLLRAYKNISNSMERLELLENGFSFKDTEFTLLYPSNDEFNEILFFVSSGKEGAEWKTQKVPVLDGEGLTLKRKKGESLPAGAVLDMFLAVPLELPAERSSPWAAFLSASCALAQALARASSFVPEVRVPNTKTVKSVKHNGAFYISYRPLDRSGKLVPALDYLASIMPPGFIYNKKEKAVLTGTEAVLEFLSIILSHIVHRFAGIDCHDKICGAFFRGEIYRPEKFEEEQTAKAISDWLGWLNLHQDHISPVIKIGLPAPGKEKFKLKVYVENKKDPLAPILPLKEIFSDREELFSLPAQDVRREVARQMTIAGEYLPVLKALLSHKGKKYANFGPAEMTGFLTEEQQICSLLGIRVIIPKELKKMAAPALSITARVKKGSEKRVSYLNLADILDFSWEVSIGDINISREEFIKLAKSAEGIVRFRDHYLMLKPEEVKLILEKLDNPLPRLTSMEILQASITGEASGVSFNPDAVIKKLANDLGKEEEIGAPAGLKAKLRPYQQRGLNWLYANTIRGLGSCLADDMGLGKTLQVIALMLKLKEDGWLKKSALVICPTTLIGNWVKECKKFAPSLRVAVYHGSSRRLTVKDTDVIITSYGILRRDAAKFKKDLWDLVVIDEAQNIKNPDTDQTKAVKSLGAKSYIAMSGTPVENRLMELWSIFDFINKGYLGKRQDFARRFALPIEKYRDREKIEKLRKATAPFLMRRLKSDRAIIADLPDKIVKNEYCYLTGEQAALYKQVTDSMMKEIEKSEGIARKGLVFKLITSLKQICNHPVLYSKKGRAQKEYSGKAEKVLSILESIISGGEKALVFTQYKEMGELLVDMIKENLQVEALFFHGGLPRKKRDEIVEKFQNNSGSSPVMLISLKAGGTGLNLTAATNVIHYDLWWNPAVEEQATDRAYRIGQTNNVIVHRLISLGTFEEKIDEMITAKKELAELTVTAGESRFSELSNEELREIFILED